MKSKDQQLLEEAYRKVNESSDQDYFEAVQVFCSMQG
jgi:HPt (histidine-containing phosphotransfer) domain-containing protein